MVTTHANLSVPPRLFRSLPRRSLYWCLGIFAVAAGGFVGGYEVAGDGEASNSTTFHDMRVLEPPSLTAYVDGKDPAVKDLAGRLHTYEQAYLFVRDQILYDVSLPVFAPVDTLSSGRAGCLGKAVLLASLYRALGMNDGHVRVVTGQVRWTDGPIDHAWLELEHRGQCLQQDPTSLLGIFEFDKFKGTEYTQAFVRRELFCFNDKGFAVVSLSNRFRGGRDPHASLTLRPQAPSR
jgi:hypothetical protein